jgi:hypothetical protein
MCAFIRGTGSDTMSCIILAPGCMSVSTCRTTAATCYGMMIGVVLNITRKVPRVARLKVPRTRR